MLWQWVHDLKRGSPASRWPVRRLIWPFVILMLIAGWAAVLRQADLERRNAENDAIELSRNRALALEQYVVRTLQAANLLSLHLGYESFIHMDMPAMTRGGSQPVQIVDAAVDKALFAGAHVVDLSGNLIASTWPLKGPMNVADHPVFARQQKTPGANLVIGGPFKSRLVNASFIHASRNVMEGNRRLGYVSLQMSPGQLINFPQRASFKSSDLVSVIGLNGISLARREGSRISTGEDLRGTLVMRMQQRNPNGTYVGPSAIDQHVRYFSHRRLRDYPIFVTAGVSRSDALAPAKRRALGYYLTMGLISLVSLAMAWFIGQAVAAREKRTIALAEAFRRLAEAQRVARIGDWECDLATGKVLWSDQLCEMYERPSDRDQLTLEECRAYLRAQDVAKVDTAVGAAIATGEVQTYEVQVQLPSGDISHRHVIAVPVKDDAGRVVRLYGTDQDVTQDNLVRSLHDKVAHLDRQGAMSMMAGTLAHELNQPLTAAANYLTGARRLAENGGPEVKDRLLEGLALAKEQVHGAAEIIRRVREMVKNETDATRVASLSAAVENSVALLAASGLCRDSLIGVELEPGVDEVRIDAIQLQQVLVNLLRNALEAAPADDPKVAVRSYRSGRDTLRVEIVDNGPGFTKPPDQIFSPFQSEKEKGTGLGLSICRTIVEYHGGRLFVDASGAGRTVMIVQLQLAGDQGAVEDAA